MKVTLINYTACADSLLLFAKSTRLNMDPALLDSFNIMSRDDKLQELEHISNTIPSSWEFVDYIFLVEGVSRAYTHQQVRTRAASYAQQTMRVLDMGEFEYIYPEKIKANPGSFTLVNQCLHTIKDTYKALRARNHVPEDCRGILPTNISTNIVCKFNLRSFVDLVKSRTGGRTQNEYQQVVNAMVDAVLNIHPWVEKFLFKHGRDYFKELEEFAYKNLRFETKNELLKIIDHMRQE